MADIHSAQDFIRALKANSDPPVPNGPLKIEIATNVWDASSFVLPNKAEVVAEWILSKLLKDRSHPLSDNPIFDIRYWTLLENIFASGDGTHNRDVRLLKTWLGNLLHRIAFAPILATFLDSVNNVSGTKELSRVVSNCTSVLWPLGSQKSNAELLQECFGLFSRHIGTDNLEDSVIKIGNLVVTSYRAALSNSSNKKKLYSSFLQAHLAAWLAIFRADCPLDSNSRTLVIEAGIETLFNLDIMRQSQHLGSESSLFAQLDNLKTSYPQLVSTALPELFTAFVKFTKAHQGALFSQGSKSSPGSLLENVKNAGLSFFVGCQELMKSMSEGQSWWQTQVRLLRIVHQENILHTQHLAATSLLTRLIENIISTLTSLETSAVAAKIECLTILGEADYDFLLPFIPRILTRLLGVTEADEAATSFLEILLDFHSKTRTLDTLLDNITRALLAQTTNENAPQEAYTIFMSSPLFGFKHLLRFRSILPLALTPSQGVPVTRLFSDQLKDVWEQFHNVLKDKGDRDTGTSPTKRDTTNVAGYSTSAIRFALTAQYASAVLSFLPLQSLPPAGADEIRQTLETLRAELLHRVISSSLKHCKKKDDDRRWAAEIVVAAALRLAYALSTSTTLALSGWSDEDVFSKLDKALDRDDVLPELKLDMFRVLLFVFSTDNAAESFSKVLGRILVDLEKNFRPTSEARWSGRSHTLTRDDDGRAQYGLATFHMLLDRWLPAIDQNASFEQLQRLLHLLFKIRPPQELSPTTQLQPEHLLLQTLHSTTFWELPNLRDAFLQLIDEDTSSKNDNATIPYDILLLIPFEYFSSKAVSCLVARAIRTDLTFLPTASRDLEPLLGLRLFLKRVLQEASSLPLSLDSLTDFVVHLQTSAIFDVAADSQLTKSTLSLLNTCFSHIIKRVHKADPAPLLKVIPNIESDLPGKLSSIRSRAFIQFVDLLTSEFSQDYCHADVLRQLDTLQRSISSVALPLVKGLISSPSINDEDISQGAMLVALWSRVLSLRKWMAHPPGSSIDFVGQLLARSLMITLHNKPTIESSLESLCEYTFAIVVLELHFNEEDKRHQYLDFIIAVYISFSSSLGPEAKQNMDARLSQLVRTSSPADFQYLTSMVSEFLQQEDSTSSETLVLVVHLADLLLRQHPPNTLVHVQPFFNECIRIFCASSTFNHGHISMGINGVELVAKYCSDQQAALRPVDLSCIWSFVGAALAPSTDHDEITHPKIFHRIIAILGSLIRLRRDLISHTLPHLGMVLQELILTMRRCRPNLGAKQVATVLKTQPRWISAKEPLKVEDARALARLIESLTNKTTVRVASSAVLDFQKAESLAKPFSKHAAYVLKAYIQAVNDPLCVLPLDVRKELEPGVFALCEMMSEYDRDGLMASALDITGKTTMKLIWKEYEKQRYIGKG